MTGASAYLRNGRRDLLATDRLGHALYRDMHDTPDRPVNVARFVFLDPRAPGRSSSTGPRPPATWSRPCGSRPVTTRATAA